MTVNRMQLKAGHLTLGCVSGIALSELYFLYLIISTTKVLRVVSFNITNSVYCLQCVM